MIISINDYGSIEVISNKDKFTFIDFDEENQTILMKTQDGNYARIPTDKVELRSTVIKPNTIDLDFNSFSKEAISKAVDDYNKDYEN